MRIDLHTHSKVSDGTDTPAQLVTAAAAAGLDVVALTDHDTTSGWAEAAAALPEGLTLVPGMELSCASPAEGFGPGAGGRQVAVHLLAYLFDPEHPELAAERLRLRGERTRRLRVMAERMAADGLPVDPDAVLSAAGPSAGRPHLARALMEAGVVSSVGEAFSDLLSSRGRYYVHKEDTPLLRGVHLVAAAGGVSVLAHCRAQSRGAMLTDDAIAELVPEGLGGVEVDHVDHDDRDRRHLRSLAAELGLFTTGSSDYHGRNKVVRLGTHTTGPQDYEQLLDAATGATVVRR
ncbi:PHP domain-containing protein [Rhodococcus sp. X156]|uniref:PHP domain-containing protein n=1 Tax=Rhodococcus sp. X156 TaxID=2499145 RepID=UPI000FDC0323|nr:PHP domain-containing protein [Rhodococcus sp. X156]